MTTSGLADSSQIVSRNFGDRRSDIGMIISIVIDPAAFDGTSFQESADAKDAFRLFEGVYRNGVILVDEGLRLLHELHNRVRALPSKGPTQRFQIRLTEMMKEHRGNPKQRYFVRCPVDVHDTGSPLSQRISSRYRPDVYIVPKGSSCNAQNAIRLSDYICCDAEKFREHFVHLPLAGEAQAADVDEAFIRTLRFARKVRLFDRYLATGDNIAAFAEGVQYVFDLWDKHCAFDGRDDAEIVSVIPNSKNAGDIQRALQNDLAGPLSGRWSFDITISVKRSTGFKHPRFLECDCAPPLLIEGGFDLFLHRGGRQQAFKTFSIRLQETKNHLADWESSRDSFKCVIPRKR